MASAGVSAQWYLGPISSTAKKKENEKEKGKAEDQEKGKEPCGTPAAFRGGRKMRAGRRQCSMDRNQ